MKENPPPLQAKPLLRWAGSKKKIIPKLMRYWEADKFGCYIEPFAGSAQLFYAISPRNAILSDINNELVSTYITTSKHPTTIHKKLSYLSVDSTTYYNLRKTEPETLSEIQRAVRFLYLNKYCFNGIYRTNNAGQFNVPFSNAQKQPSFLAIDEFINSADKLKCAKIFHGDFENIVLNNVKKNDFVYLDPPYAVGNRRIFRQYGPQTFGQDDLNRLSELLIKINERGAFFLLSYAYCKESIEIASNWNSEKLYTKRNVSGFAEHRRKAAELIITNITIDANTKPRHRNH